MGRVRAKLLPTWALRQARRTDYDQLAGGKEKQAQDVATAGQRIHRATAPAWSPTQRNPGETARAFCFDDPSIDLGG
jgi:hypothetical protein